MGWWCAIGQLTLEFLLAFILSLALSGMLSASLSLQVAGVRGKAGAFGEISRSESVARALEAVFAGGMEAHADFREEGVRYRIEGGRFHEERGGRVIEIKGVFDDDGSEPV
jgi:hypothetical protein